MPAHYSQNWRAKMSDERNLSMPDKVFLESDGTWNEEQCYGTDGQIGVKFIRDNLAAERERKLVEALRAADQFIRNGIELGYIRMPDPDTPDSAHDTPKIVADALAELESESPTYTYPYYEAKRKEQS
jgi:hypothetical protein